MSASMQGRKEHAAELKRKTSEQLEMVLLIMFQVKIGSENDSLESLPPTWVSIYYKYI